MYIPTLANPTYKLLSMVPSYPTLNFTRILFKWSPSNWSLEILRRNSTARRFLTNWWTIGKGRKKRKSIRDPQLNGFLIPGEIPWGFCSASVPRYKILLPCVSSRHLLLAATRTLCLKNLALQFHYKIIIIEGILSMAVGCLLLAFWMKRVALP